MNSHNSDLSLLCRVQTRLYALPLTHVIETMRPLPIEPMADASDFVCGLSIIRGEPMPVIDLARLSGIDESHPTRFVTIATGTHRVALAVDGVLGVRSIPTESLRALPPLLQNTDADIVSAVGMLDAELFLVLSEAHLVPEDVWAKLEARKSTT